jgi:hypothetical protein
MFYALALDDLVEPGIVEVSASGVTAARLLLVTGNSRYSLSNAGHDDMVVVQRTPGQLPSTIALTTGTPQAPLTHVLNRDIPNVFLRGAC